MAEDRRELMYRKSDEIIDSLNGFTVLEKYIIISNLYFSFLDIAKKEGIILDDKGVG